MRISDWSSDVFSSDLREKADEKFRWRNKLRGLGPGNSRRRLVGIDTQIADAGAVASDRQREIARARADVENDLALGWGHVANEPAVRKSGVLGMRVSGRVDLGGRRIVQKKTIR